MEKIHKEEVKIQQLRRITGYLVSDVKFWNEAKRAELEDRVKHAGGTYTMGGRCSARTFIPEIPDEWLGSEFIIKED